MGAVKLSRRARINYVADFETTTDPDDCRVWSWGYVEVDNPEYDNVKWGTNIEGFIQWCMIRNANVYFHNLKFDGTFIMDWLLKNGYTHSASKFKVKPGMFKSVISDMGKFYSITVTWVNGKTTEFRDSLKKFPNMSVKRVAGTYGLEETKGEIDYAKPRPVGYQLTPDEVDYLKRDIVIVAKALQMQFSEGMEKLTLASDCMAEFKDVFGVERFKRTFPSLPDAIDEDIRHSYRGGFTYADERFVGKKHGAGLVLDVNSLYPYIMYTRFLPYGNPRYFSGRFEHTDAYPLACFSVTFTAKLKPRHIPCIQIKGQAFFVNTEYLREVKDPTTLWVTTVDWKLWNDHYDIEVVSFNGGWKFKGAHGFFDEYIEKWSAIKAASTGGRKEIAKGHLNNLYGKFGSNPNVTSKVVSLEDDCVKLRTGENETRPAIFTAMASFITAYARELTIRAAQDNYDIFAYADTDSLHLFTDTPPSALNIHPTELGAWKLEYTFQAAWYVRSKFYLEQKTDGTFVNRMAGVPEQVSSLMTFDDVIDGNVLDREWVTQRTGDPLKAAKLSPRNVPGGVVLIDVPYTVKL